MQNFNEMLEEIFSKIQENGSVNSRRETSSKDSESKDSENKSIDIDMMEGFLDILESVLSKELNSIKEKNKKQAQAETKNSERKTNNDKDKMLVGLAVLNCDLKKKEDVSGKCGLFMNIVEDDSNSNKFIFEIAAAGFNKKTMKIKKIKTVRNDEGERIAKTVRIELNRKTTDTVFEAKTIPTYIEFELAFFGSRKIGNVSIKDGLIRIEVIY